MTAVVRIGDYAQLGSHEQVYNILYQQHVYTGDTDTTNNATEQQLSTHNILIATCEDCRATHIPLPLSILLVTSGR
jgi:hypothetical protein